MLSNIDCNVYISFFKLQTYNIFITHQPFEFLTQLLSVSCEWFSSSGLLRNLHVVVVWEYYAVFNTKYFLINLKITALFNRNRSAVLAYIYIHTHKISCRRESDDDRHTHTRLCPWTLDLMCTQTHTHIWGAHLIAFQERFQYKHTQVTVYWRFGW